MVRATMHHFLFTKFHIRKSETKTKVLISCAVTAQLICVFVFAYANCWFSHANAQLPKLIIITRTL